MTKPEKKEGTEMLIHWIWLATLDGLKDREKLAVLTHFRDPEEAFFADAQRYAQIEGLSQEGREALQDKNLLPAENVLADCARAKLHVLTYGDGAYPTRLKNIPDPPLVLYYKGKLPDLDGLPVIGVVGTRKASMYGMTAAKRLGYQIGKCGGVVVSGMAYGIDGMAMQGALTAGATVVGVLGCGADVVYPVSNKALFADLERCGCLISEFLPGTPPYAWNFPKRNRIISGLANGVLVVEAPEKSGALITARQAAEQGRDVFVVPGNIDVPTCAGSNALLRDGAIMVSSGWDVVSEYRHLYPGKIAKNTNPSHLTVYPEEVVQAAREERPKTKVAQKSKLPGKKETVPEEQNNRKNDPLPGSQGTAMPEGLNETEQTIVAQLLQGERLVDDVIAETGLPAGKVLGALTLLEVRGVVKTLPGKRIAMK